MKKAKVMLFVLVLLAYVGAAFAFKANRYSTHFIYTGVLIVGQSSGACMTEADGKAISKGAATAYASTTILTSDCLAEFTTAIND